MHNPTNLDLLLIVFSAIIWLGMLLFLKLKKQKTAIYLLFFTIFFIYIYKVLDYTLFQFQSLLILKYLVPNLILNGQAHGKELNLIPLLTLTSEDLKTSFLNVFLFLPFGFGLPFITNFRLKQISLAALLCSVLIELLQLSTGLLAQITFRIADINDVIFNTLGAIIGYLIFIKSLKTLHRFLPQYPHLRRE